MIALHFGKQFAGHMYEEVQEWAITHGLSIEDATNDCYRYMTWSLSEVNNNWQSHFDIMFSNIYECLVYAPDVIFDVTDFFGFKAPTLLLKSNYVTERYAERQHHIGIDVIDAFGQAFQQDFGLEYLGFELASNKKVISVGSILNDYRSRPNNSVTYLIGNKPHYYNGKRFLPIIYTPYIDKLQ